MRKKIISLALALAIIGTPVIAHAANHYHVYDQKVYWFTTQDGSYSHQYESGYNPVTGVHTYDTCWVSCETETYRWTCSCGATDGSTTQDSWDCHGKCGLGDVKVN